MIQPWCSWSWSTPPPLYVSVGELLAANDALNVVLAEFDRLKAGRREPVQPYPEVSLVSNTLLVHQTSRAVVSREKIRVLTHALPLFRSTAARSRVDNS